MDDLKNKFWDEMLWFSHASEQIDDSNEQVNKLVRENLLMAASVVEKGFPEQADLEKILKDNLYLRTL